MKRKMLYADALMLAEEIRSELHPLCESIEIAGSLRRQRAEVGDIEIVAIPKYEVDLFGEPTDLSLVDAWAKSCAENLTKNGQRMKQFSWGGAQVDLFLATPMNFGYILMLRTGSAEFSRRMVTPKAHNGLLPHNVRVEDGTVFADGKPVAVPTEAEIWQLWNMAAVPAAHR